MRKGGAGAPGSSCPACVTPFEQSPARAHELPGEFLAGIAPWCRSNSAGRGAAKMAHGTAPGIFFIPARNMPSTGSGAAIQIRCAVPGPRPAPGDREGTPCALACGTGPNDRNDMAPARGGHTMIGGPCQRAWLLQRFGLPIARSQARIAGETFLSCAFVEDQENQDTASVRHS
jgi:hypothetical protein